MRAADLSQFSYSRRQVRVVFGHGSRRQIADEAARVSVARALIITTRGRTAIATEIATALGDRAAGVFAGAVPHVPAPLVAEALDEAAGVGADGVVAIGGGSAIGLGKAIARGIQRPLIAIPTTYSGSEMTDIWGITDEHGKRTARDPHAAPAIVIYDPSVTLSLSPAVSATSGMNAIAHAVEALYARDAQPLSSLAAAEAIRTLALSLPVVVRSPRDLDARTDALRGAHLAGIALDATSMGLHHKLAHVLGGSFGLPHAETHAVLLPHVVRYNQDAAPDAMREIAAALGVASAADGLRDLDLALGVTYGLRDLGLNAADVDRAAGLATSATYPNPRVVTTAGVSEILRNAF